jgi:hypothetical protein
MDAQKRYLYDWGLHFFRSRDLMLRNIRGMHQEEDHILIDFKVKTQMVLPVLDLNEVLDMPPEGRPEHLAVIAFNTNENFKKLNSRWDEFAKDRFLSIYFINPMSDNDTRWMIMPYNHSQVADPASLKKGLKALFESVDAISSSGIKKVINEHRF